MKNKGEKAENIFVERLLANPDIIIRNSRTHHKVTTVDEFKPNCRCKSDVTLDFPDGVRYECSIKCIDAAPYAVVNHTSGFARAWNSILDERERSTLEDFMCHVLRGRDVRIGNLQLTDEQLQVLRKVVRYFSFNGTGCGVSRRPATCILLVDKNGNLVRVFENEDSYLDEIMSRLEISVRSKGGKCKETWGGNLHIRVYK